MVFHLIAIGLMAIPAPSGGLKRTAWQDATVQAEIAAWADRLSALGVSVTPDELEKTLWRTARQVMKSRREALAPFDPYYTLCGTHQSWRMFVAPYVTPSRLFIDLREDGAWRPLYRQPPVLEGEPEAYWKGALLDHTRMRSALFRYSWPQYSGSYARLTTWLAGQAAAEFPRASRLRLRWQRRRTPSPKQARRGETPKGVFHSAIVRELDEHR